MRMCVGSGNLYFSNAGGKESSLKDSMKFFHSVLRDHSKNVYATNGLGMICAEKGENDVAREIFSRVRVLCLLLHSYAADVLAVRITLSINVDSRSGCAKFPRHMR